ncbi:MAG: hypothetical protein GX616_03765 [Planctomycetes bacterium]|nr:hypothetical protein [Planctomycetota bacterium]
MNTRRVKRNWICVNCAGGNVRLLAVMNWPAILLSVLTPCLAATDGKPADSQRDLAALVAPIRWERFTPPNLRNEDLRTASRLLLNSVRYNLAWAGATLKEAPEGDRYLITDMNEPGVRPPASAACGIATAIATGIYDEKICGMPKDQALSRAIKIIRGDVLVHRVNGDPAKGWGDHWQSALWAMLAGRAGWMLWEHLDPPTRHMTAAMIEYEADRFIRPGYTVPYWNGKGGDSKAEENAWNATVLQLAVAMMPRHPRVPQWKRIASELMVSAFAREEDMKSNPTMIDGRPVKEWLKGYNIRDDGALVNHNIVHCDYMTTFTLNLEALIVLSLADQPAPESADFNAAVVYRSLVEQKWPSPPYKAPGGTMYVPGKVEVYYPEGTDWSNYRFDIFYSIDCYAHLFGWDKALNHRAGDWMRLRAGRILEMQARHPDGRMFAKGEFDTYGGAEQMTCWMLADAFLLHWLHDIQALSRRANWNRP